MTMKLKINPWRLVWRFAVVLIVMYVAAFFMFFFLFFNFDKETGSFTFLKWDYRQPLVISIVFLLALGAFIPSLTSYYYVIENKYFIMKKYGKEIQFDYSNIEFIDIEESKKKKMVIFYGSKCKMRYLLGDKDGVLLETLIKKCPNTMSVNDFRRKHPEEKY